MPRSPLLQAFVGLVLIVMAAGCSRSTLPTRVPERFEPQRAAEVALETYDQNGDGQISGPELDESPALKISLDRLDANGDDAISGDEIAARMEAYDQQSRLIGTMVQVVSNGQRLDGAEVRFEFEPFMGEDLPAYVVTTDASGSGVPKTADTGELASGLPLGFYRVTISHPSEGEVVRGCEMADDVPTANRLVFSMQDEGPQSRGGFRGR